MKAQQRTILVADDNAHDRMFTVNALKSLETNCTIQQAGSGNEAIAYLKGEGQFADRKKFQFPGYIITDLKMADGDGFDLLNFLRANPNKCVIPVVVLSGSGDSDDVRRAYALGAGGFLVKPHLPEELRSLLKKLYDFFSECEVPQVTDSGTPLPTSSLGKLGSRFLQAA